MDNSNFNLEKKINEFLENFNKTAISAIDDDFNDGLIRSRSKFAMDDDGLEMTGNGLQLHDIGLTLSATKAKNKAPLFSIPLRIQFVVPQSDEEEKCAILSN